MCAVVPRLLSAQSGRWWSGSPTSGSSTLTYTMHSTVSTGLWCWQRSPGYCQNASLGLLPASASPLISSLAPPPSPPLRCLVCMEGLGTRAALANLFSDRLVDHVMHCAWQVKRIARHNASKTLSTAQQQLCWLHPKKVAFCCQGKGKDS